MIKNVFLTLLVFLILAVKPVLASVSCTTQYGGGQTCVSTGQLLVDKKVYDSATRVWVDNTPYRFQAGNEVIFSVAIKNVGDNTLNNVQFTDTLPNFLVWSSGEALSSQIDTLTPGQTVTKVIRTRVVGNLPNTIICNVNAAAASTGDTSDRDTAQICVGQAPAVTPSAGPEMAILALLPGLGGLGFYLRNKVW